MIEFIWTNNKGIKSRVLLNINVIVCCVFSDDQLAIYITTHDWILTEEICDRPLEEIYAEIKMKMGGK